MREELDINIKEILNKYNSKESLDFEDLLFLTEFLRSDKGCPWDRKQTIETVISHTKEETEELIAGILNKDMDNIIEELGDVLFQVVFIAQIISENENIGIENVIDGINRKLIRRHEHVFGEKQAATEEEALRIWTEAKKKEKSN